MKVSIVIEKEPQKLITKLSKYAENSIQRKLLTVILSSIQRLSDGDFHLLYIKSIEGNKGLKEIIIKTPLNYRIFFQNIEDKIYIIDIREKKRNKFPQSYFDILSNRIKRIKYMLSVILYYIVTIN